MALTTDLIPEKTAKTSVGSTTRRLKRVWTLGLTGGVELDTDLMEVYSGAGTPTRSGTPNAIFLGGGTNTLPVVTDTAKNFMDFRLKSTALAAAGDIRGLYLRLELASGATGEALRPVTRVSSTTGLDSAHGAHCTLSIAAAGKISGLGCGVRATLETDASANPGGTLCALQVDSNVGASATLPATTSLIRLGKAGTTDVTTFMDISDDQCLKGSSATGAATDALPVRMPNGTTLYISLIAAS